MPLKLTNLIILALFWLSPPLLSQPERQATELLITDQEAQWLQQHPQIIAGVERNWAPYGYINENEDYVGIARDYLDIIEKKLGISIKIAAPPAWETVIKHFHLKEIDLLPAVIYSRNREQFLNHTTPYLKISEVIFAPQNSSTIKTIDDLKGRVVAVPKGYVLEQKLYELFPDIKLLSTASLAQALQAVSSGQADAYIGDLASTSFALAKLSINNIKPVEDYVLHKPTVHMGIRKDWPELKNLIEKVLASMTTDEHRAITICWSQPQSQLCKKPQLNAN